MSVMADAPHPRTQADREELAARIARALPHEGRLQARPGLYFNHVASPSPVCYTVLEPALCVIAQGRKDVRLGSECFRYDPAHYLITTLGLPVAATVVEASPERPHLSLRIDLDPAVVTSVLVENGPVPASVGPEGGEATGGEAATAVNVSALDADLLDAVLRLVRLAESPGDYRALGPLVVREIVYRLLTGTQGGRLRHLATVGGHDHRMVRAVRRLSEGFAKPLRIDDVAAELGMSVSGFHAHFKAVTSMSPLQFQKHLRLQEARRLMLGENLDAGEAGYRVGYDDPAYFSREYKRHFGEPPTRDVARLREAATA